MRIAIVSDTHSLLRPEVAGIIRECDQVLHAGDIASRKTYEQIRNLMVLTMVEDGTVAIEKKDLSPVLKRGEKRPKGQEMDALIRNIIKDMHANLPVSEISRRNRVEPALTEEILQIYTTHPGIDTDGILNRMKDV